MPKEKPKVGEVKADLRTRHGMATASMVLGIIGIFIGWIPFFGWAIVATAIIFGFLSFSDIKHHPDKYKGKSQAVAGIVMGFYVVLTGIIMLIISVALIASAVPLLGVVDGYTFSFNCVEGSGHLWSQDRELSGFSKIDASEQVTVYITQADNYSVVVNAENNLIDHVRTKIIDDTLVVDTSRLCFKNKKPVSVEVTMPDISYIDASSGASVVSRENILADDLFIDMSSAADVILSVQATKLRVDASSASQATLSGTAGTIAIDASSASIIDAYDLIVSDAAVEASSASVVNLYVINTLEVDASSASLVNYLGNAQVTKEELSSAASLEKK